jgi:hypothetical protein
MVNATNRTHLLSRAFSLRDGESGYGFVWPVLGVIVLLILEFT